MTAHCAWRLWRRMVKLSSWTARKPQRNPWKKKWIKRRIVDECANVPSILSMEKENLVVFPHKILYVASNCDGSRGEVLASMCESIGVTFIQSPILSARVCLPCGRKIRNLCKLFVEIKKVTSHDEAEMEDLDNVTRNKRQLSIEWDLRINLHSRKHHCSVLY